MPSGPPPSAVGKMVTVPLGVMRPIPGSAPACVNHRLPSGPSSMSWGELFAVSPGVNSVTVPSGVMRPIAPPLPVAVYQTLPSGPAAMPVGLSWVPPLNSDMTPPVVTRPIWFLPVSVNHTPPGPDAIPVGCASLVVAAYVVTVPAGAIVPICPGLALSANQTLPSGPRVTPAGPLPAANSLIVGAAPAAAGAQRQARRLR